MSYTNGIKTKVLLSGKRPSESVNSKHLRRANIPFDLGPGRTYNIIEINTTDMCGKTFTQTEKYRIIEK